MWGNDSRDSNADKIDRPCPASLFTDTCALFCTSRGRLELDAPDSPAIAPAHRMYHILNDDFDIIIWIPALCIAPTTADIHACRIKNLLGSSQSSPTSVLTFDNAGGSLTTTHMSLRLQMSYDKRF